MMGEPHSADGSVYAGPAAFLIDGCDTLPKLFLKRCGQWSGRIAMREKDFGIWQSYTWSDYRDRAFDIAHGLLAMGLRTWRRRVDSK